MSQRFVHSNRQNKTILELHFGAPAMSLAFCVPQQNAGTFLHSSLIYFHCVSFWLELLAEESMSQVGDVAGDANVTL